MTKYQIPNLLEELKSDETYIRNDAIKKIIKGRINDEQIDLALRDVIENDPSTAVRKFAQSALDAALNTPPLTHNEMNVTDKKSNSEIKRKASRFVISIRAIILVSGSLFILFKVQGFWEYAVGWKIPIWPYFLVGAVLIGLIYYWDNRILLNKSKVSSAGLIFGLVLTLGLGIPACLGTFILMNVSGIFLIFTIPIALVCSIVAIILLNRLTKLLS